MVSSTIRFKSRYCKQLLHRQVLLNHQVHLHHRLSRSVQIRPFQHRRRHLHPLILLPAMHPVAVLRHHHTLLWPLQVRYLLPARHLQSLAVRRLSASQRLIHPVMHRPCRYDIITLHSPPNLFELYSISSPGLGCSKTAWDNPH